ncbi:MAG: hypothetical protein HC765_08015 [Brachymonas sp.]|nr:hypothetical protein [Brachymonas sp.]
MQASQALSELAHLSAQLPLAFSGQVRTTELVQAARNSTSLLQALPDKYSRVLHDILDRLESGALFTEESCSFSQRDLLDSLAVWIDKAHGALNAAQAASSR